MEVEVHAGLRFRRADERLALERQYAELWEKYGAGLARVASSYEALPQAKEDLMQDIRLAIWMALPSFRSEASLRTFVYRIAHNRGLTHVWRRRNLNTADLEGTEIADTKIGPDSAVILKDEQERFMKAIRSLPVSMRQVMTLALEDITRREIGEILGISENNVAVRLNRARGLMRQKLGGME